MKTVKKWTYRNLACSVAYQHDADPRYRWYCGYAVVPNAVLRAAGDLENGGLHVAVFGGVTYDKWETPDSRKIGWDSGHPEDDAPPWTADRAVKETEKMVDNLRSAIIDHAVTAHLAALAAETLLV